MTNQTEITFAPHTRENNPSSQKLLDDNYVRLTGQNKKLLEHFLTGKKINADTARELYGIRHLPRRVKDVCDKLNIYASREYDSKINLQWYWFTKSQCKTAKERLKDKILID